MLKRIALLAVIMGLALVLGTPQVAGAGANDPAWITAANTTADGSWPTAGYQGLPDLHRASGGFLVMNGAVEETNQSLEGVRVGRHIVRLTIPAGSANVRVGLFDANTTGLWDQNPDGSNLLASPRVVYQLFVDPDGMTGQLLRDADPENLGATLTGRMFHNIDSNHASLAGSENKWCSLYDSPFLGTLLNPALHAAGTDIDGDVNVVFHARVIPNRVAGPGDAPGSPGTGLEGTERVGYKLAFNGTFILPNGTLLGFGGGVIDERYPVTAGANSTTVLKGATFDPLPGMPIPGTSLINNYTGVFNFLIHYTHACGGDIGFNEADADWNKPIPVETPDGSPPVDQFPTGVPPDNGGAHNISIPANSAKRPANYLAPVLPLHDNAIFSSGNAVEWMFLPVSALPGQQDPRAVGFSLPFWSSDLIVGRQPMPANWLNHASVNVFQQGLVFTDPNYGGVLGFNLANAPLVIDPATGGQTNGTCWQAVPFTQAVVLGQQGLWNLRWQGLDASNFVFMRFTTDVGTTPRKTQLRGRLFCDDNSNGTVDQGETFVDGGTPAGTKWNMSIQAVDAANIPVVGKNPVLTPVDASGNWGPVSVPEGRYAVTAVPLPGASGTPGAPVIAVTRQSPTNWDVQVDVPVTCTVPGSVCGIVYCSPNCPVGAYNPATDTALNGATVTLTGPTGPNSTIQMVTTGAVPGLDPLTGLAFGPGRYCFTGLQPGAYTVTISGTPPAPAGSSFIGGVSPTSYPVTILQQSTPQVVDNNNFGYCCQMPCKLQGRIWCDDNMNGVFDLGETPLSTGYSITVRHTTNPLITFSPTVAANGTWMQNVFPGVYNVDVFYLGTKNFPANVIIQGASQQTKTCAPIPGVTPQPPIIVDFTFKCVVKICGTVYCSSICPVGAYMPNGGDFPLPGTAVQLSGPTGPMSSVRNTTTALNGSYCFTGLVPGIYTITVGTPTPPPGTIFQPTGNTPGVLTVVIPQTGRQDVLGQDFGFCCTPPPGDICVKVFCDDDCDGLFDDGEPGYAGVNIVLTDSNGNIVGTHTSAVSPTGGVLEFCFTMLPAGNYTVSIAGNMFPVNVQPSTTQTVPAVLIAGGKTDVIFGICKLGEICGRVWLDGGEAKCDGIWTPTTDTPLGGFLVSISHPLRGVAVTLTNPDGTYCFPNLLPGQWRVNLPAPFNTTRTITLASQQLVNVGVVGLTTTSDVDFWFCKQTICGRVWCEPSEKDCDGVYTANLDKPIAGLEILLTGTSGDALNLSRTALTDTEGRYCFDEVPTGGYELRVSDNPANLPLIGDGKIQGDPIVRTLVIGLGDCPDEEDFYYCPECEQKICVKVFKERGYECDGTFDEDVDVCLEWIEVFVTQKGNDQNYLAKGFTNSEGYVCFEGLEPGEYWVYVGANQERLYGLKPCITNPEHPCPLTTVVLVECEDEEVSFCYCEPCPQKPCCEGDLHEVVIDAKVWVGECDDCFAVSAHLLATCGDECADVLGEVWMDYCGSFPGPKAGLDGVVTIESVRILNGVAIVRVRLVATGADLASGKFGDLTRGLAVFVNGKHAHGCIKLRCETARPGVVFPWTSDCGAQPKCVEKEGYVWDKYWDWFWCDACPADFIVVHTQSYKSWRYCNPCTPEQKWKTITLTYKNDACVDDHVYMVKLKKGRDVLDQLRIEFWGDEWAGPKDSAKGYLTIAKVWQARHGVWKAIVKVHYECGCGTDALGEVKVWSKIDGASKDKRVWLECETADH